MDKIKIGIGIDIGSVSVKLAVFSPVEAPMKALTGYSTPQWPGGKTSGFWRLSPYVRHQGSPVETAREMIAALQILLVPAQCQLQLLATGNGGRVLARQMGLDYINDFKAASLGAGTLFPGVRTVFELGGEQAKYLRIDAPAPDAIQILDYETNGDCAAGTGSFFDQQAGRLHYAVDEVSAAVSTAQRTAHIAGRCSVFAKSDMIHAQQRGYAPEEVLKGLCEAVVRNFKGTITKGKQIETPVLFSGGVAQNQGIVQALRQTFDFHDGQMIVPVEAPWLNAAGAALQACSARSTVVEASAEDAESGFPRTAPLSLKRVQVLQPEAAAPLSGDRVVDAWLGLDIGSVSTNLALIDKDGKLLDGIYTMTRGRPIEVVREALTEMASRVEDRVKICGVGSTGSGRELIGMLCGADVIKDEITAHKTGALSISRGLPGPSVDTIFEIGGQDSKFIAMKDGVVIDFTLNEACAAGTGSFLEEQATELGIAIKGEFAAIALSSEAPIRMGERCTVFMEKELKPYLHRGAARADVVAGLALSVVQNYLNRVVKKRPIGETIFFQGGTAYNHAVAAAFATVLDKDIIVPPHNGIMGAIGAALLAQQTVPDESASRFRGWHLEKVHWRRREIACKGCENRCIVQEFDVEGETSYWGDKCSTRFRKPSKSNRRPVANDLFALQHELLTAETVARPVAPLGKVALPMVMQFWDRLPFWRSYFYGLNIDVLLTGPSNKGHVDRGVEAAVAEPCFPIQMGHGHLTALLDTDADWIFLPNVVNEVDPTNAVASFICPWAQTLPLMAKFAPALASLKEKIWHPNVQFRMGRDFNEQRLFEAVCKKYPVNRQIHRRAWTAAESVYANYQLAMRQAGKAALDAIAVSGRDAVLLVGRPYNLYDPGLNLNIPFKLRDQYGADVIPMDGLDLDTVDITGVHDHMFWNYGRRIIQAAQYSRNIENLHLIYLSNFKCGPDSYIRHYIEEAAGEPFLFLQLDSHANDAGVMTRIEAFLESKRMR